MAFLTRYGTLIGEVTPTLGRILFVSPSASYTINGEAKEASDDNDGLAPDRAVRTVARAIALATASVGDVIALLPGTHTSATQVAISKAGLTFVGINPQFRDNETFRPYALSSKVNWTSTLAGVAVALTAADCAFIGINMIPVTAQTFMSLATCPRTSFVDCAVTLSATASTSTKGIVASGGSSAYCSFTNCAFINTIATSAQGPALDITGLGQLVIESCVFLLTGTSSAWAVAVQCGSGTSGVIRNSAIAALGAGTITIGFDGTGVTVANSVHFQDMRAGVSPGVGAYKTFDADSATTVNCLTALVSGAGTSETSNHLVI